MSQTELILGTYLSIRLDTCLVNNTPRVQPQNSVGNYICVYSKHGRSHTDQWNNLHAGALGGAWATRLQILGSLTLALLLQHSRILMTIIQMLTGRQCDCRLQATLSTNTDNR